MLYDQIVDELNCLLRVFRMPMVKLNFSQFNDFDLRFELLFEYVFVVAADERYVAFRNGGNSRTSGQSSYSSLLKGCVIIAVGGPSAACLKIPLALM